MKIDQTDRQIINALLENGRASSRDIASQTGVAATTVTKRLTDLEENGVIESYDPTVDYDYFAYDVTAVFRLSVEGDSLQSVVETLQNHNQMVDVYEVTGDDDIIAIGKFTSTDQMNTQIKELLTDPAVTATNTNVVLNNVKEYSQFPTNPDTQ